MVEIIKRLISHNDSYAVLLPINILTQEGFKVGEIVKVTIEKVDKDKEIITYLQKEVIKLNQEKERIQKGDKDYGLQ